MSTSMSPSRYRSAIARPAVTLARLVTSNEKKYRPVVPSGARTYVRTLVSGNLRGPGSGSMPASSHVVEKQTIETHDMPSNVSATSGGGSARGTEAGSNGQWKNATWRQSWRMTGGTRCGGSV